MLIYNKLAVAVFSVSDFLFYLDKPPNRNQLYIKDTFFFRDSAYSKIPVSQTWNMIFCMWQIPTNVYFRVNM